MKLDKAKLLRDHQIEQILLRAHIEREGGVDLIDEYFYAQSSLDPITRRATQLIKERGDPEELASIAKNLSECIVVKSVQERLSLLGRAKSCLSRVGIDFGKSREVLRAEKLIKSIQRKS